MIFTFVLHRVSSDLFALLTSGQVSGEDQKHSDVTRYIIDELISKTRSPMNVNVTLPYTTTMLDIFQRIISDISFR